jgi:hypothetical protein
MRAEVSGEINDCETRTKPAVSGFVRVKVADAISDDELSSRFTGSQ